MSVKIGSYSFGGYYSSPSDFEEKAGIYAVFCRNYEKDVLIDIGESDDIRLRVENNEKSSCWRRTCASALGYVVLYTPDLDEQGRIKIEEEIRDQYNPVCGRK